MSACGRRLGGRWFSNRFSRSRRFSDGDLSGGRGHFTQASEAAKFPRIPLIGVGLAHLQGSLPGPCEESGFLTALPDLEGEYQPTLEESNGLAKGENRSIPRCLKNLECCRQTRPISPETLRPARLSLASQGTRTTRFKPEPNERTSLYSFLRRAPFLRF